MKLGLLAAKFTGIDNDAALFARYGIESYHFTKRRMAADVVVGTFTLVTNVPSLFIFTSSLS